MGTVICYKLAAIDPCTETLTKQVRPVVGDDFTTDTVPPGERKTGIFRSTSHPFTPGVCPGDSLEGNNELLCLYSVTFRNVFYST
ncbi:hypothetical protein AVEN_259792-1 [Araneus ventricosus]|uniref:Uncharacterized protein n=1 Tax=Araneus ventricosus TaxID=182803 RepID=A0A4Y2KNY3_ARAVE|nr:hypothetical protein AVEN_259792-1 [Araneus ventricosus]